MKSLERTYCVERISTEGQLRALQEPWRALLAAVPNAPIFLTWEWVNTWWRHFCPGKELWVLAAWDASGRLAGVAPWVLASDRLGPLRVRRVMFLGSGRVCPDHLDVIAPPEEKETVCGAFLRYVGAHKGQWDVVDLQGLPRGSVLGRCLAAMPGRHLERRTEVSPFIRLPVDWGAYFGTLSVRQRKGLRNAINRLEREHLGQVRFHRVTEPDEVQTSMDTLAALNRARWHSQGRGSSFDAGEFRAFHHEMATTALQHGWLRLLQLRVADRVIGTLYCFRYGDVFYAYQSGFDLEWAWYSPGRLIMAHAIREAIKEGAREFDMLRGREAYKFTWADQVSEDVQVLLSHTWRGLFWLLGVGLWGMVISGGRKLLPERVRDQLNRLLASEYPRSATASGETPTRAIRPQ